VRAKSIFDVPADGFVRFVRRVIVDEDEPDGPFVEPGSVGRIDFWRYGKKSLSVSTDSYAAILCRPEDLKPA